MLMQSHGSLEPVHIETIDILVSAFLLYYLFSSDYIITHDTRWFIIVPMPLLKIITLLCWWQPQMQIIPGECRNIWTKICFMFMLNFHSGFYTRNIEHLFQPCLLLYSLNCNHSIPRLIFFSVDHIPTFHTPPPTGNISEASMDAARELRPFVHA